MSTAHSIGRLVVVGTPIGNLGDLSPRAVEALTSASVIACEDTRRTGGLCTHLGIDRPPFLVANEHTELARSVDIVERIRAGETVAVVSDAGMPGISDPGERLVRAVLDAGLEVDIVPGPTAMTTALVASGLPTERFVFEGFLPRKGRERAERLADIGSERRTVVLYESPRRVVATLADLAAVCGPDRRVAVARELTKMHQDIVRGDLDEVGRHFDEVGTRGEFVIVLDGAPSNSTGHTDEQLRSLLRAELAAGATTRDAVATVVATTRAPKRRVYALATAL